MDTFFSTLQDFVLGLPDPVQFIGVAAVGAIPFVESYGASTIGIAAGVPIPLAVLAAVVGNIASVLLVVYGISSVRNLAAGRGGTSDDTVDAAGSGRRGRVAENVRRVGVPGASLLGPLLLPSQVTSAAMVGIGANRNVVFVWTSIAVTVWGLAIGLAAAGLFTATGVI
ncbi:hypothetical protein [Dietzia sp. PP-33]|jgi:hypothetical protein|uniref:hypothetical protein n=1 Tax=Dietzia sp. PP-33 TaxID=2957500 RepID=UPI0029BCD2C4|nr:hypothetical protein [Dietzia sp. PP-33]MDX2356737.1 hypothetical protein [Dietzia sp. PP-33]